MNEIILGVRRSVLKCGNDFWRQKEEPKTRQQSDK